MIKIKGKLSVFCLLSSVLCILTAPAFAATISGRVEVDGPCVVKPRKLLEEQIKAQRSLICKDGRLKNAVVLIKGFKDNRLLPTDVVIDQRNKTFIPHVIPITIGSKAMFKNSDTFVHRIISNSEAKRLRMEFAYEGATQDVIFDKPGIVEIWCDDHKRMQGWILVLETPFFAVTDENGYFTIPNLPSGTWTIEVWHEVLGGQSRQIDVKEGEDIRVDFKLPGREF